MKVRFPAVLETSILTEITVVSNEGCEKCIEVKEEIRGFFPNIKLHSILFKDLDKENRSKVRNVLNSKQTTLPAFILKDGSIYNGTYRELLKDIRYI